MRRFFPLALALAISLTACGGRGATAVQEAPFESTIFAMDTVMTLSVYGSQAGLDAAVAEINALERLLSVTREDSEVWAINHSGGAPVSVSGDTAQLLQAALTLGNQTGGALDVTLYPVVCAWGFTTGEYQIPDEDTLRALLERVNYQNVHYETEADDSTADPAAEEAGPSAASITLPQGVELDFGALAKGYAGEKCAQLLKDAGVTSAILRLGGNIQTVGAKPDGSAWIVAIQDPGGEESSYLGTLRLVDQAAVTSGGYQRYFEENGVRYWHILDPKTGRPAQSGLTSVTIVGDSGTLCDGLSTALFVMGREKALEYWRTSGGFEAVLADEDNNLWVTGGLADSFALNEDTGYTLHIVEE